MNTPISFSNAKLIREKAGTELFSGNMAGFTMNKPEVINLPTIAEVVMWLYEKYGVWIYPLPIDDNMKLWQSRIIKGEPFNKLSNTLKIISHGEISYRSMYSPTEAYEAAIEYTLKNLIS